MSTQPGQLRIVTTLVVVMGSLAAGGCGDSPATPDDSPATPDAAVAAFAPSLAQEINASLALALRAGLGIASLEPTQPETFFESLLRVVLPKPAYAQTAGFVANCRSGGTVRVTSGYSTPGGGRVVFNNGQVSYSSCGYPHTNEVVTFTGGVVTFSGTLTANGTWTAADANNPVTMQGSVNVDGIGPVQISCTALSTEAGCNGNVGGVTTGPADTPPSPNPNSCPATVTPNSVPATIGGGTFIVEVTVAAVCPWTAGGNVGFVTVTAGASRTGPGSVTFVVSANGGAERTGALSVAGQIVTITQAGVTNPTCLATVSPSSFSPGSAGGTFSATVNVGSACPWTAVSSSGFVTVTSGATGSGNGTVTISVAANTGAARSGSVSVAGQIITVNQAAASAPAICTPTVSPASFSAGAGAGTFSTTVTAGSTCAWTAVSNSAFITVTAGASGTGNGSASFSVAANTGIARTGSLTVAGQTVTVSQAAGVGALNVSGTWRVSGSAETIVITQSGTSLSCSYSPLPPYTTASCGGTINGSSVNMTLTLVTVLVSGPYTATSTSSIAMSLIATNTTMTGTYVGTSNGVTTTGPPPLPPNQPPTTTSGPMTLTKQ